MSIKRSIVTKSNCIVRERERAQVGSWCAGGTQTKEIQKLYFFCWQESTVYCLQLINNNFIATEVNLLE